MRKGVEGGKVRQQKREDTPKNFHSSSHARRVSTFPGLKMSLLSHIYAMVYSPPVDPRVAFRLAPEFRNKRGTIETKNGMIKIS